MRHLHCLRRYVYTAWVPSERSLRIQVLHSRENIRYTTFLCPPNPEVEAGDKTDGITGYKKRCVSL